MERIRLTRGGRSASSRASLRVTIQVRRPVVLVSILVTALLAWAFLLPGLVRSLEFPQDTPRTPLGIIGLVAYIGLGLVLLGRIAWFLVGRETFDIRPRALSVRRAIGPFAVQRNFRCEDLQDFPFVHPGDWDPPWKRLFLQTDQEALVLRHRHRMVRLTRNLDKAEGAYLLTAIRLWMQHR